MIFARSATSVGTLLKSIAFVCVFVCLLVRSPESAFRPRKYRLAPQIMAIWSWNKIKIGHPIIHSLIEVYVIEKSIVDKHGDATARHRTDIETEWCHRTFPPALRAPALQSDV